MKRPDREIECDICGHGARFHVITDRGPRCAKCGELGNRDREGMSPAAVTASQHYLEKADHGFVRKERDKL
jgi:uncharacterized Zn finger protein